MLDKQINIICKCFLFFLKNLNINYVNGFGGYLVLHYFYTSVVISYEYDCFSAGVFGADF